VRVEVSVALSKLRHVTARAAERRAKILGLMQSGVVLPPITLGFDAHGRLLLRSGNHRLWAARRLGLTEIAVILDGTRAHIERVVGPLRAARIVRARERRG